MGIKVVSEKELREKMKGTRLTIIDFYADWCGPCKQLTPILEEISKEGGNFDIYKVNVDDESYRQLVIDNMVVSIPTVVFFKEGRAVNNFVGLQSKGEILEMIRESQ